MSIIINAEIPAGPTIEQAIKDCVEFAAHNHCMVKTTINDIPMLISYGTNFTEHPGMPYSVQDCTDFFVKAYHEYRKAANKDTQDLVNSIGKAYEKAGFANKNPWE